MNVLIPCPACGLLVADDARHTFDTEHLSYAERIQRAHIRARHTGRSGDPYVTPEFQIRSRRKAANARRLRAHQAGGS